MSVYCSRCVYISVKEKCVLLCSLADLRYLTRPSTHHRWRSLSDSQLACPRKLPQYAEDSRGDRFRQSLALRLCNPRQESGRRIPALPPETLRHLQQVSHPCPIQHPFRCPLSQLQHLRLAHLSHHAALHQHLPVHYHRIHVMPAGESW